VAKLTPLSVMVTPGKPGPVDVATVTIPEMLYPVRDPVASVKSLLLESPPLIVTVRLAGVNVQPIALGVRVYCPFARPVKV
jgi:hypothetical protein